MSINATPTDEQIFCPYCEKPIESIVIKMVKVNFKALFPVEKPIYACPHCKKILPGPSMM